MLSMLRSRALLLVTGMVAAAPLSCRPTLTPTPSSGDRAGGSVAGAGQDVVAVEPNAPPVPGPWATNIGPRGVQWVQSMVVDTEGNTHVLTAFNPECSVPGGQCRAHMTREQSIVTHDPRGELRRVVPLDLGEGWVEAMTFTPEGWLALLCRPVPSGVDGAAAAGGSPRIRMVEPSNGELVRSIGLDLEADPGATHFVATPDGDFVVAGEFEGRLRIGAHAEKSSSDEWDVFVARFGVNGRAKWQLTARGHTPGLSGQDTLRALELLSDGDVAISGGCRGKPLRFGAGPSSVSIRCGGRRRDDAYVARLGPDGALRWVRHLEATMSGSKWSGLGAVPVALAEAPDHGLVVAGLFSHVLRLHAGDATRSIHGRGFTDSFVARYDAAGALIGAWQLGGPGQDRMADLVVVGETVWLAGTVAGDSALRDTRPSTAFVDHDPESLQLPMQGVLVALRPDGSVEHLDLRVQPVHPLTSVNPAWLLVAPDGLRMGGDFAGESASFPLGERDSTVLLRRVPRQETYDSFLWAPPWEPTQRLAQ